MAPSARRIVPAIPHRLSRNAPSARPVALDKPRNGLVAETQHATQAPEEEKPASQQQPQHKEHRAPAVNAPIESGVPAREVGKEHVETEKLASSPTKSAHDRGEHGLQYQKPQIEHETNGIMADPTASATEVKPVTNGVHRKLPIPAELPPPFYPSNKVGTQTPPADENDTTQPSPPSSHMQADAAAFTTLDGSPATPVTPYEIEQDIRGQQTAAALPPPGFSAPEFAPPFFPGHSHHPSNVNDPWSYPPYPLVQPDPYPAVPDSYPRPYDGHFPMTKAVNGMTTPPSQSPSKSQFGEVKPNSEHGEEIRAPPYQNGATVHVERFENTNAIMH